MTIYGDLLEALRDGWMVEGKALNGYELRRRDSAGWQNGLVDLTLKMNGSAEAA